MALALEGVGKPLVQGGDFGLTPHQTRRRLCEALLTLEGATRPAAIPNLPL